MYCKEGAREKWCWHVLFQPVCMHACMHALYGHVHMYCCIYVCPCVCMYVYICVCMHVCMHVFMCVLSTFVRVAVDMFACIYVSTSSSLYPCTYGRNQILSHNIGVLEHGSMGVGGSLLTRLSLGCSDALIRLLLSHADKPRVYIGCMKSGEVFSEP